MPPSFVNREFWFIAPEILLATWGLLVLVVDFAGMRKATVERRNRVLGLLSLVGTILAILVGVLALTPPSDEFLGGIARPISLGLATNDYSLFAGTLAADPSTAFLNILILVLLAMVIGLSMSWGFTVHLGEYYALLLWATVGMMLLIASEELVTLFLTLETMTLCLYMMAALEKTRRRSAEAGLKYFVYGSVSSALFLFGLSLIYGMTGTTTFTGIRSALSLERTVASARGMVGLQSNIAGATAILLVLVGVGFKIAAAPFHQWAPDTYEGAPAPVAAWIAAGSKIASFVALMKLLLYALPTWASAPPVNALSGNFRSPGWIGIVAVISAVSMTYGNFAALAQKNLKRMLAYSSIAHAGYMLVGVLAAAVSVNEGGAAGAILFYLVVYGFGTLGAFAVATWLVKDKGSDEISDLNGLGYRSPFLSVCIVLLMLSLIGMPPLAGFFGKFTMFSEAMNSGERAGITLQWLVMLGLFNSVVSAFYYVRVLKAIVLRPASGTPMNAAPSGVVWGITLATLVSVVLGLYPAPVLELFQGAALPMLSPGARLSQATTQDPKTVTTQEQRDARAKLDFEKFKAGGGSGPSLGGPAPKARPKSEVTPPKNQLDDGQAPSKKSDR